MHNHRKPLPSPLHYLNRHTCSLGGINMNHSWVTTITTTTHPYTYEMGILCHPIS